MHSAASDVVIVGSGPSGSAAAIWCAKLGLNVTLIERSTYPKDKPGESLHPGVEPLFDLIGVSEHIKSANFVRHYGISVQWSERDPILALFGYDKNGPWLGYQAPRAKLDKILIEHAKRTGVKIGQPCSASDIILDKDRIVGVKTSQGDQLARFIIDASGSTHWLARKMKINIERFSPPLLVQYGYAKGLCIQRNTIPSITATSYGWLWTARVGEHFYQWTRLVFDKESLIQTNWLPDEFSCLDIVHTAQASDVTWRRIENVAGKGYFVVGEAAMVFDPVSSHGVLWSLISGIKAAELIAKIKKSEISESIAETEYRRWNDGQFFAEASKLKHLYSTHPFCPLALRK
jgi:flavin-dependent dehydrogenase